ncbi:hypothetical protein SLNHY_1626 [Streptomyces albus]|nr:hypothetical protein SLNHY_1626 [Streptomyces albus]
MDQLPGFPRESAFIRMADHAPSWAVRRPGGLRLRSACQLPATSALFGRHR